MDSPLDTYCLRRYTVAFGIRLIFYNFLFVMHGSKPRRTITSKILSSSPICLAANKKFDLNKRFVRSSASFQHRDVSLGIGAKHLSASCTTRADRRGRIVFRFV